jgi:hypothetical protein
MTTTKKTLLLLALALGACRAQNRSSIEIRGRAPPSSQTECSFTGGGTTFDLRTAILDVGSVYNGFLRYEIPLYVDNLLSDPTEGSTATTPAAKSWLPEVAKVRVNPSNYIKDLHPSPALLAVEAENTVPIQGQSIPVGGKSVQRVLAVSQQLGQVIQAAAIPGQLSQVVLGISLQGHTADGQFLETGEWYTPVTICVNCLACTGCTGTTPICPAGTVDVSSCGGPGQDTGTACVAATP